MVYAESGERSAGDLDGDGRPGSVSFDQRFRDLIGLRRTGQGIKTAWRTPVGGKAVTTLATAVNPGGGLTLGVGREDGSLRLWLAP